MFIRVTDVNNKTWRFYNAEIDLLPTTLVVKVRDENGTVMHNFILNNVVHYTVRPMREDGKNEQE